MGFAKAMQMQQWEQGWSFSDGHVCAGCVDDYALAAVIERAADSDETCSFCGTVPAADLDVLVGAFVDGLRSEFGDADNEGVSYDSGEGGYVWNELWDSWDLVSDFGEVLVGDGLLDAVRDAVEERVWVRRDFAWPRRDEALRSSWAEFCEAVQYKTRYVFWLGDDATANEQSRYTGEVPPTQLLEEVGELLERLDLIRTLPAGSRLWRTQTHGATGIEITGARMGTAPRHLHRQANRMSPAGIPMFYGSSEPATAMLEATVRTSDSRATTVAFDTSRDCTIVDFTDLPPIPSMFDPERAWSRRPLLFLHDFVRELVKPCRDEYEQIDYVPTQVVTEYLLRVFLQGEAIHGLRYPSAITGEPNIVLDVPNDDCLDEGVSGSPTDERLRLILMPDTATTRDVRPAGILLPLRSILGRVAGRLSHRRAVLIRRS